MHSYKDLKDEEIVKKVWNEDVNAFRELMHRYQQKLLRYAVYLVRDEDMAADVVQNSFIKAYTNLRGFNTKLGFSSWIYRIVHNEAMNCIAKNKPHVTPDEILNIAHASDVEANFVKQELLKQLDECLNQLPVMYRAPLTLFFLEEKSYAEISDILRLPLGTVGTRINRAKNVVRNICQKKDLI